MERKMKLAAAISLLGLTSVACAPNPYWQYPGTQNRGTATTPRTAPPVAGVTHNHCGKVHTHALPPQGLAHHHGDGCMAGNNTTTVAPPPPSNTYTYNPPVNTNPYTSNTPVNNYNAYSAPKPLETNTNSTYYYDYTGANNYTAPTSGTTNSTSSSTTTVANTYTGGDTYLVQKGDTVFQVMRNTGVYWKDIIRLNNLQPPEHTIQPGQTLRLK